MRKLLPFVIIGLVLAAFLVGGTLREKLGIEWSPESLQVWLEALGWKGPAIFIGFMVVRPFLLIPNAVVLIAGGLCFGLLAGTVLGTVGILISALLNFAVARYIHGEWTERWVGHRIKQLELHIESLKSYLVGVLTAYPVLPMAPIHLAAGISTISLVPFLVVVTLGGAIRAGAYSFLGSTLSEVGSSEFYIATLLLVVMIVSPLLVSKYRRELLSSYKTSSRFFGTPTNRDYTNDL